MKKPLIILTVGLFFTLTGLFISGFYIPANKTTDETRTVYIKKTEEGFHLYRNGNPFYLRGAGGNMNLQDLAAIGGNTIRVYDTINLKGILNEAYKYNIAVIVDISIPPYHETYKYYSDKNKNRILINNIRSLVNTYKDHPALLMWNLGNELYFPFVLRKNDFVKTFNELIEVIQEEDPNHPVSTSIAGVGRLSTVSLLYHSPRLDLLAFNIFSDTRNLYNKLNQIFSLVGKRPYYISEYGSDGPWEVRRTAWGAPLEPTSTRKAEQVRERYHIIEQNKTGAGLGSLAFYWGNKLERTYTWFSYFVDGHTSEVVAELGNLWNKENGKSEFIGIENMLIDGKGVFDNIIFTPNELKRSELKLHNYTGNIEIKWELYQEIWPWAWSVQQDSSKRFFNPKKTFNNFESIKDNTASFITPEEEGPYRLFAYVIDENGYFATANVPFYILDPK